MWRKKHIKEFDTICVSGIHWVLERTLCRKGGTTAHHRQRINVLNTEWFSLLVKWKKKYAAPQIQDNVSSIWYRVDTQKWQLWSIVENSACAQPTYRPFWRSHWGSSVGQGVGGKESNGLWGGCRGGGGLWVPSRLRSFAGSGEAAGAGLWEDIRPGGNPGRPCSWSERNHPSSELGAAEYQPIRLVIWDWGRQHLEVRTGNDMGEKLKAKGNNNDELPMRPNHGCGWRQEAQRFSSPAAGGCWRTSGSLGSKNHSSAGSRSRLHSPCFWRGRALPQQHRLHTEVRCGGRQRWRLLKARNEESERNP